MSVKQACNEEWEIMNSALNQALLIEQKLKDLKVHLWNQQIEMKLEEEHLTKEIVKTYEQVFTLLNDLEESSL